ncbi:hypothetical protein LWI28_006482 [Acer negundo]|uniref:Myb/SANT-like domain-containing protein n=1 Tax=Acer negundo TaxID=4023 RepID=A0AAD5NU86_ACENE|nr:hypothetical protein LWI28_006482 [Acer negundo]
MAKKAKINAEGGQPKKNTMKWTESMDVVLFDALLEQQANGNRIDGTFTTTAYNNVLKICREELKYQFDKDHLKNRIKTLKINFNACYDLFKGLSGFSWSPVTRMFEAEPEVWNTLIESKPSAKKWRVIEIQNYDKLLELFAKDRANGEGAISAKEKVKQWEKESCDQFVDLERLEDVTTDNFNPVSQQCNSQGANSSKVLKRKASMVYAFERQVEMIQVGMNNVADAIREGNVIAEIGIAVIEKTRPRIYEEQDIYAELLKIGVPDNVQLEAFLFLVKSPLKTRAFFAVPSP